MRELKDYNDHDMPDIVEQAKMIALMAIHSSYDSLEDDDTVCTETMCKVKEAIKTLYYIQHLGK